MLLGIFGLTLFVQAISALGPSLTPFPRPSQGSALLERGVYGRVRHPIYRGVLLLARVVARALAARIGRGPALLPLLLELKSRLEESTLLERYPEYGEYRSRVRRRFVPFPD